ncbi:d chain transport protein, partial [Chrysochromulina tobinii]
GGGREEADERKGGAQVGQAAVRRKKEEKKVEEGEGQQWNVAQWLQSLALHDVVAATLELPEAGQKQFQFMRALERPRLEKLLNESDLISNMCDVIMEGARFLTSSDRGSTVANDKFQASGKFQMSYGSLSLFYGGLESLIGPPKMLKGSLFHSMEQEHTGERDARCEFTTSNGVTSTSAMEWEVVINPKEETRGKFRDHGLEIYPERKDFRELYPDWCRAIRPIDEMMGVMETECNARLRHEGHTELIREELVGGRLYTGPLYAKYNAVLRSKSGDAWLVEQCKLLTLGNTYTTTIHAINSCVIKLSKLTKAVKVWRGIKDAKLPKSFWVANSMGVRGGIEYGFSSTTTDKEQALHYAGAEDAHTHHLSTVFEMQMGMVDRGADLTWLSQYPHEREVLLPPLTGLEALETRVSSGMLVIQARLSLNMAAHTLEQVLSRRRKMLMDMRDGIGLELRDVLDTKLAPFSVDVLSHAMDFDALKHEPEWFNNDENFAKVMQSTLRLQHNIVKEASKLHGHLEKPEISFHKWAERGLHGSRATMLVGWVLTRDASLTNPVDVALDLRDASLTSEDGLVLAEAFRTIETITSIDVRGNPALEGEAVAAIVEAMKNEKPGKPRSICGVTPQNTRLEVPRNFAGASESVDTALIVAELESHFYSESVTAGMGGPVSVDVVPLNRRGGFGAAEKGGWLPLIWAAKMNHMQIGRQMIRNGTNVNVQEPAGAKSKKYTALHQACYLGHLEFAKMLLDAGADQSIQDVSGQTAKQIADKKGHTQLSDNVSADFDSIVRRSAAGVASCKEVLGLMRARQATEEAYGQALLKQGRSAAGLMERGTCRMGLVAFKSQSEKSAVLHMQLAAHLSADVTALTYLRDRCANAHRALVAENASHVRDMRTSKAALQKARAWHARATNELDALAELEGSELAGEEGGTAASVSPPPVSASSRAFASAMLDEPPSPDLRRVNTDRALQLGLREVEASSAALSESLRQHLEAVRLMSASLPKLLSGFERGEGQRIDSIKMALKKLINAQV